VIALALAAALAATPPAKAAPAPRLSVPFATVNLTVTPGQHKLQGSAKLRCNASAPGLDTIAFTLHPGLKVSRVTLNDRVAAFKREGELIHVSVPRAYMPGGKWVVGVEYAGRPVLTDGPRILQDVAPNGVLLHPKGHWFPEAQGVEPAATSVNVKLPSIWRACGPAGRQTVEARRNTFHLEFAHGIQPTVAAAPFKVYNANDTTCFLTSDPGAPGTLARGAALAKFYQGHGVPGALPRTLVELPPSFAPVGAAGWEAAPKPPGPLGAWLATLTWLPRGAATTPGDVWLTHGLVAYTSDLLTAKEKGEEAYQAALQKHQAAYEAFLRKAPTADVPLAAAIAPNNPAWGPVVLDKGALVWSLVHEELGDQAFWELLAKHHAALEKGDVSLNAFLELAGRRLEFVSSWLGQPGLPRFKLEEVHVEGEAGNYQVTGVLGQAGNFQTPLEVALVAEDGVDRVSFQTFGSRVPFHFVSATRPLRLMIDPAEKLPLARVRHLWVGESLRQAGLVVAYGTGGDAKEAEANRAAALALAKAVVEAGGQEPPVVADGALGPDQKKGPLALVGRPSTNAVIAGWEDQLPVRFVEGGKALWWQGRTFQADSQGVIQAIPNPDAPDQPVVVLSALSPEAIAQGVKFGTRQATYCVFDGTSVLEEGDAMRTFPDLESVLY
jgi:hypothetical protein